MAEGQSIYSKKYSELSDQERDYVLTVINDSYNHSSKYRNSSWQRLTNFLFVLNTGALIATLAYVTGSTDRGIMQVPIWCFAIGTTFSLIHSAVDYYVNETDLSVLGTNIAKFYDNEISYKDFKLNTVSYLSMFNLSLQILGWGSSLLFLFGMFFGICNI